MATSPVENGPASYAAPMTSVPWWLSEEEFGKLEFFGPKPLTGRVNCWLGIAPDGRIFVYSFTI